MIYTLTRHVRPTFQLCYSGWAGIFGDNKPSGLLSYDGVLSVMTEKTFLPRLEISLFFEQKKVGKKTPHNQNRGKQYITPCTRKQKTRD